MRDIKRIKPFMNKLAKEWEKYPDLRFVQFVNFLFSEAEYDSFFYEEADILKLIDDKLKMSDKYNKIIDSVYDLDYDGLTIHELEKVELSIQNELDDVRKSLKYKRLDDVLKSLKYKRLDEFQKKKE
ncbi:hypothetical protein [Jeotgalibaca porci]|uniref:hypothetical protein n=1 Tax=Jeotgalibaca porci TaxID=1868793 RepID=UPI00359FDE6B